MKLCINGLFAAVAIVGQHPRGRIAHVAALPRAVRHPEILNHRRLARIVFLKQLAIQKALLRKRLRVGVRAPADFEFLVRIRMLGIFL